MLTRVRADDDLPALVEILRRIHLAKGYPVRVANVRSTWLAEADELGSWVAVDDRVVGHVALHHPDSVAAPLWREATGRTDAGLAVVSRLISDQPGAGSLLLELATEEAYRRDLAPVLEVDLRSSAHGLYLRRGWTEVGEVDQQWGPNLVRVAVMVRPA